MKTVTSHTEVWIEITSACTASRNIGVTSHTEVWIEIKIPLYDILLAKKVTSHTEVWIEIYLDVWTFSNYYIVTSHTEVWIEIVFKGILLNTFSCHLPYGGVD